MDNLKQKKRTSFTLDNKSMIALKRASKICNFKDHELAIIVTKLTIRRLKFRQLKHFGVRYNNQPCKKKVYPYLTFEEQFSLRQVRSLHGISISYLICLGVELFLAAIIFRLLHNYAAGKALIFEIESYLTNTLFSQEINCDSLNSYTISFLWRGG